MTVSISRPHCLTGRFQRQSEYDRYNYIRIHLEIVAHGRQHGQRR